MPHRINMMAVSAGLILSVVGCQAGVSRYRAGAAEETPSIQDPATQPAQTKTPRPMVSLTLRDPVPAFDDFVTWKDAGLIDGRILHYWGNEPVGRGGQGMREILARLSAAPPGRRILIYPEWEHCLGHDGIVFEMSSPWRGCWDLLRQIAEERDLILILSPRDHLGRMCPESQGRPSRLSSAEDRKRFPLPDGGIRASIPEALDLEKIKEWEAAFRSASEPAPIEPCEVPSLLEAP